MRLIRRSAPAAVILMLACSGGDSGNGGTDPEPVSTVTVNPPQATLQPGQTQQLTAQTRDAAGNVLTGRTVTWSSNNEAAATVSATGLVLAAAPGNARITATSEGRSGGSDITVNPPAVASVTIAPAGPHYLTVGQQMTFTATALDAQNQPIAGKTFAWSSSNQTAVAVTQAGVATAQAVGVAQVRATVDGVQGSVSIEVAQGSPVVITQITPATLIEGQAATITGTGFSATAAQNSVMIEGVAAAITQATATTLQVTVPAFDCRPPRNAPVQVTTSGAQSNIVQHPVGPAGAPINLAVGQQLVLDGNSSGCLQFAASNSAERYIFGVQSVSESLNTITSLSVGATVPSDAATFAPLAPVPEPVRQTRAVDPRLRERMERWGRHIDITAEMYEQHRRHFQPMFNAAPPLTATASAAAPTVPASVQEGEVITVRFPAARSANPCLNPTNVQAKVRKIIGQAIILEDQANPVLLDDATIATMAAQIAQLYDIDVDQYGTPSDIDGNQRIVVLFTREVNELTPAPLAFVFPGDRVPVAQCASSNEGEFFYALAVDPNGALGAAYTLEDSMNDFALIFVHEFAHIIQISRRAAVGGQIMVAWVAEALATGAQEIAGFEILGLSDGQNYGPEFVEPFLGADARGFFTFLYDFVSYFGLNAQNGRTANAPEQCGWLSDGFSDNSGVCSYFGNRLKYALPWTLIKQAIDNHHGGAAGQKNLMRAFSEYNGGPGGFAEVSAILGKPMAQLMAEWAPILFIDERFPAVTGFQMRNFKLTDVVALFGQNAPLQPRARGFTAFVDNLQVRASSSAYYDISGPTRPATAIRVRDSFGAPPPNHIQVWIVRVQ